MLILVWSRCRPLGSGLRLRRRPLGSRLWLWLGSLLRLRRGPLGSGLWLLLGSGLRLRGGPLGSRLWLRLWRIERQPVHRALLRLRSGPLGSLLWLRLRLRRIERQPVYCALLRLLRRSSRSRLGFDPEIRLGSYLHLGRSVVLAKLRSWPRRNRRYGKFHGGRRELFCRLRGCRSRRPAFQPLSLCTESLHILPMLPQLLSLCLIDRLESQWTVLALGELGEGDGQPRASCSRPRPTGIEYSLVHPCAWWSGIHMIAAVLEVGCDALFPLAILAMLPALVGVNRIVAKTAGVVRIRGVEPCSLVVGGVVVTEVVVLVLRPQEEMISKNAQVDHRCR